MSAKVSEMFSCPRCMASMSSADKPEECPKCKYKFAESELNVTKKFTWGKDPYLQLYELVQQDMEMYMDKPVSDFIPGIKKDDAELINMSNEKKMKFFQGKRQVEMHEFFLASSPQEVEGLFKSIIHFYQVVHKSGDKEVLKLCVSFGAKLGDFSKTLNKLMEHGAYFYDRKNPTTPTGDSEGDSPNT